MRVVTIGGGHGQAALLAALVDCECDCTAIVSIADDGGCSGKLRHEFGMPPPGDLRRCLSTLAADRELAGQFETRLQEPGIEGRSAGNLVLSEAYRNLGSLQAAIDWAAGLLLCRGRVVPVAERPGVLAVYDSLAGTVEGETTIERTALEPMVVSVYGPTQANPAAVEAIEDADFILIGPGSFVTSVLATLSTADLAAAVARAHGRCVLVNNIAPEGEQLADFRAVDYIRLLRDHLTIYSRGHEVCLSALLHREGEHNRSQLEDNTPAFWSPLAKPDARTHDPARLAASLCAHFGFVPRTKPDAGPGSPESSPEARNRARQLFADQLQQARMRLAQQSA